MRSTTPGPLCNTDDSFPFFLPPLFLQRSVRLLFRACFLALVSQEWKDLSDLNSFASSQWLSVFQLVGDDGKRCFTPGFSSRPPSVIDLLSLLFFSSRTLCHPFASCLRVPFLDLHSQWIRSFCLDFEI